MFSDDAGLDSVNEVEYNSSSSAPVASASPVASPGRHNISSPQDDDFDAPRSYSPRTSVSFIGDRDDTKGGKIGKITVGDPELRGGTFDKHHAYKVSVVPGVVDHVFRRYRDFSWLRGILVKLFPGVFIPPLPPKKMIGSKDETFVEERRADLTRFLRRIARRPFLADSEPFQMFLTRAHTFEDAVKELNKQVDARSLTDTLTMFQEVFPDIVAKPLKDTTELEMANIKEYLTSEEEKMTGMVNATDSLARSAVSVSIDVTKLHTFLGQTYDVEKGYPGLPHPPRVDLVEQFSVLQNQTKDVALIYGDILAVEFKYELQDIQSMLELVKYRESALSRHKKALEKASKWSLEKNAPKNEKQELQKSADLQSEKDEKEHLDTVTKLILYSQAETFHQARMKTFRRQLAHFAREQANATKTLLANWETMAQIAEENDAQFP